MRFLSMVAGLVLTCGACSYQAGTNTEPTQGANRFDIPVESSTTTTTLAPAAPPTVVGWFGTGPNEINPELVVPERLPTPADLSDLDLDGIRVIPATDALTGRGHFSSPPESVEITQLDLVAPSGAFIPVDVVFGPEDTVRAMIQDMDDGDNESGSSPITASGNGYSALAYPVVRIDPADTSVVARADALEALVAAMAAKTACVNCPPSDHTEKPEAKIVWSGSGLPADEAVSVIERRIPDASVSALGVSENQRWWLSDGVLTFTTIDGTSIGLSNAVAADRDNRWHAWVTGSTLSLAEAWPIDVSLLDPGAAIPEPVSTYDFAIADGETVSSISVADTETGAIVAVNSSSATGEAWHFVAFDGTDSHIIGTISDSILRDLTPFDGRWFGIRSTPEGDEIVLLPTFDAAAAQPIVTSTDPITSWDLSSSGTRILLTTAAAQRPATWIIDSNGMVEMLEIPASNAVWSP